MTKQLVSTEFELSAENYLLEEVIGKGSFAVVQKCVKKSNKEILVAKICKKWALVDREVGHFVDLDVQLITSRNCKVLCLIFSNLFDCKCKKELPLVIIIIKKTIH